MTIDYLEGKSDKFNNQNKLNFTVLSKCIQSASLHDVNTKNSYLNYKTPKILQRNQSASNINNSNSVKNLADTTSKHYHTSSIRNIVNGHQDVSATIKPNSLLKTSLMNINGLL